MKKTKVHFYALIILLILSTVAIVSCDFLPNIDGETAETPDENVLQLSAPIVSLSGNMATWLPDENAIKFEVSIDGSVFYVDGTVSSVQLDDGQSLQVKAIGDGVCYLDSEWSNSVLCILEQEREDVYYTIIWKSDNKTLETDYKVKEGDELKYNGATPSKSGYSFKGWSVEKLVASPAIAEDFRIVIHARWELLEFSITYHSNGGVLPDECVTRYTVESENVVISDVPYNKYPEYNLFAGWYEDSDLSVPFKNDLRANPRNIDLYAKWDLCIEYDITNTPSQIEAERVIIDWSEAPDEFYECTQGLYLHGVSKILIIGNKSTVYTDLNIILSRDTSMPNDTELCIKDLNMNGCVYKTTGSEPIDLVLMCLGENSVIASVGECAIAGFTDLHILGEGNLSIFGGNGEKTTVAGHEGNDGASGIIADIVNVELLGTLKVYGGDATNGTNASSRNSGGNGGNGGVAIFCKQLNVSNNSSVIAQGGNGGNGGNGGDGTNGDNGRSGNSATDNGGWNCNASDGQKGGNGTDGAKGGNGGHGGAAVKADTFKNESTAVSLIGGNGGNGGNGGIGGNGGNGGRGGADDWWGPGLNEPGDGGNGGKGGRGGNGGVGGNRGFALDCAQPEDVEASLTDGSLGKGGLGGKGGSGGEGGNGGDGGANGSNGSKGSKGSDGSRGTDGGEYYSK